MKINRKIFAGIVVSVLLFALVTTGCATGKYVTTYEVTETAQAISQAASDLVLAKEGGITGNALIAGLGDKFPGLKFSPILAIQYGQIDISYQGKRYYIRCTMGEGDAIGGGASAVGPNTLVTGINSVEEVITVKVEESAQ